jgi:hypothetical protein
MLISIGVWLSLFTIICITWYEISRIISQFFNMSLIDDHWSFKNDHAHLLLADQIKNDT